MDIKEHTQPHKLEEYSFMWSEASLTISAIALFIGGIPPIYKITPMIFYGLAGLLLTLSWILSGVASAYLLYRWHSNGRTLFEGKDNLDTTAFFVSVVAGLNLGIVGISGTNIVGILFLWSSWHLYKRWNESGKKIF